MGDLNHDGIPDAAVLYTMEINTTNNYVHYLAGFLRLKGRLVHTGDTVVSGKHYRAIDIRSIRNNVIYCNTTDYADNDPTCCHTIKGSTKYVLKGNKLKELRAANNPTRRLYGVRSRRFEIAEPWQTSTTQFRFPAYWQDLKELGNENQISHLRSRGCLSIDANSYHSGTSYESVCFSKLARRRRGLFDRVLSRVRHTKLGLLFVASDTSNSRCCPLFKSGGGSGRTACEH